MSAMGLEQKTIFITGSGGVLGTAWCARLRARRQAGAVIPWCAATDAGIGRSVSLRMPEDRPLAG